MRAAAVLSRVGPGSASFTLALAGGIVGAFALVIVVTKGGESAWWSGLAFGVMMWSAAFFAAAYAFAIVAWRRRA